MNHLKRLLKEEDGQAMTEYGLLVGLIAIVVMVALVALGPILADLFNRIGTSLTGVAPAAGQ